MVVKETGTKGKGVFAAHDTAAGTFVCQYVGTVLDWNAIAGRYRDAAQGPAEAEEEGAVSSLIGCSRVGAEETARIGAAVTEEENQEARPRRRCTRIITEEAAQG